MKDEQYFLNQTPPELCLRLIEYVPIEFRDICWEPFSGEGAFYNAMRKKTQAVSWTEIEDGRDYKDALGKFDWIVTNPPFGKNGSFWKILLELIQRCNKGLAFLGNDYCLSCLTPKRLKLLEGFGFHLNKMIRCNVKKWRGRYIFMVFTKEKNLGLDYIEGYW